MADISHSRQDTGLTACRLSRLIPPEPRAGENLNGDELMPAVNKPSRRKIRRIWGARNAGFRLQLQIGEEKGTQGLSSIAMYFLSVGPV